MAIRSLLLVSIPGPPEPELPEAGDDAISDCCCHDRPASVEPNSAPPEPAAKKTSGEAAAIAFNVAVMPACTALHLSPSSVLSIVPPAPTATTAPEGATARPRSALVVPEGR